MARQLDPGGEPDQAILEGVDVPSALGEGGDHVRGPADRPAALDDLELALEQPLDLGPAHVRGRLVGDRGPRLVVVRAPGADGGRQAREQGEGRGGGPPELHAEAGARGVAGKGWAVRRQTAGRTAGGPRHAHDP